MWWAGGKKLGLIWFKKRDEMQLMNQENNFEIVFNLSKEMGKDIASWHECKLLVIAYNFYFFSIKLIDPYLIC